MEFILLIAGITIGFIIANFYLKSKYSSEKLNIQDTLNAVNSNNIRLEEKTSFLHNENESLKNELTAEREKLNHANNRLAKAEEAFKNMQEKINTQKSEIEETQKKFTLEFENIANKLLEEKSKKFTEQNKSNLDVILNPLKEKIKEFEEKVDKTFKADSAERITLKAEIKSLVDMNKQISEEANNLTKALKGDTKKQGNWGEVILEKVLERSGLVKDQEYKTQVSTTNLDGRKIQPDVVVLLPDNKHIIIDSKVSLIAYELFVNAENEDDRNRAQKDHILSMRNHIKNLSEKNYQTAKDINSPDFVLLFVPIESSFSIAIQADQDLFGYAWERHIVIVSPSTLLATLKTISSIWKQEKQTRNALEIAEQSGKLYDKFVGFVEDMQKIGERIAATQLIYDESMKKLSTGSGNLVKRVENIRKLGAKNTKQLSEKFISPEDENNLLNE